MANERMLELQDIETLFRVSNLAGDRNLEVFKTSILSKYRINNKDEHGLTILMYTCANKFTTLLEFIVTECFADINIRNNDGETALFWAAKTGNFRNIKFLIESGADTNIKNNYGRMFNDYLRGENILKVSNLLSCNIKPAKRN
jgi:ankyrin repeat protein